MARPTSDTCKMQILPVDWRAITAQGATSTNYQLMPGDRIFVKEDSMVAFDNNLGKLIAPAITVNAGVVPEPQTLLLVLGALLAAAGLAGQRRAAAGRSA